MPVPSRLRGALIGAAALAALGAAPAAQAYEGDWTVSGSFERTTNPSFAGGFNPNDIDEVTAAYDNRAKVASLRLRFFETPSRGTIYAALGTGLADGTCDTGALDIAIASRDVTRTRQVTETETSWVDELEYRYTWSRYVAPDGEGWTYVGREYTRSSWQYKWMRTGHEETRTITRTITEVDPTQHERVATLERDAVDGELVDVERVANGATEMTWSWGHPLLNGVTADCIEIQVPGRRAPFVIAPPATPAPTPNPAPAPAPAPTEPAPAPEEPVTTAEEVTLDDIAVSATRLSGGRIALSLTGGDAARVQIRVRRASKTVAFGPRIVLRNQAAGVRFVVVRFTDGADWSDWERVAVR